MASTAARERIALLERAGGGPAGRGGAAVWRPDAIHLLFSRATGRTFSFSSSSVATHRLNALAFLASLLLLRDRRRRLKAVEERCDKLGPVAT